MKEITGASIILTEACNLNCSYCYEKRKTPEVMTQETVKKSVDFVFDNSNNQKKLSFIWFGGEPLLNFEQAKFGILYAKDRAQKENKVLDQLIITNGTIWNDDIERFFKDNSDVRIQLSWDGMPEFQDITRGQHEKVEKTLSRLIMMDNHLTAHVQVVPTMVPKLFENVTYIANLMKDKARIVLRHIPEVEGWMEDGVLEKLREQLYLCYKTFDDKISKVAECEFGLQSNGLCGAGKNFGTFVPNGDIYACHRFYFNKNRDFKVGSLNEGFIHSSKTEILEEYDVDSVMGCSECDACELCDRCIASNFGENFDLLMPTDENCEVNKSVFYALFNYNKVNRPWLVRQEIDEPSMIASIPQGMSANDFIVNYLLPIIKEQSIEIKKLSVELSNIDKKNDYYRNKGRRK